MLLKFGIGMGNSVQRCWPLTYYGLSYENSWRRDSVTTAVFSRSHACINEALLMFTDDELLAEAHYDLGHYATVVHEYYHTEKAAYVRRHCDSYVDYTPSLYRKY